MHTIVIVLCICEQAIATLPCACMHTFVVEVIVHAHWTVLCVLHLQFIKTIALIRLSQHKLGTP